MNNNKNEKNKIMVIICDFIGFRAVVYIEANSSEQRACFC